MDISIIIPVFNSEEHICRCLESIICQDYVSCEVILVDDGSTDSSADICDRYSSEYPYIKTIHKENGGVSSARNAGLAEAGGEYVLFVDSDDALSEGALKAFSSAVGHDFAAGAFNVYDGGVFSLTVSSGADRSYTGDDTPSFFDDAMLECGELFRGPWAKLFRSSVIREAGLRFNENLSYAEDKLFVYEYMCHVKSAVSIAAPVYEYFRHEGSLSGGRTTQKRASQLMDVVPLCASAMERLASSFPSSAAIRTVYHNDLVCCDLMRILRFFMKHRSVTLTEENLRILYDVLAKDTLLTLFENKVRGQMINVALYRLGSLRFSIFFYRLVSRIMSVFHV